MRTIRLPLVPVGHTGWCDKNLLQPIELVTEEEKADFTKEDWRGYAEGWYDSWLLPEIAEPRYFCREPRPVVSLAGSRYRIFIEDDLYSEPYEADGKYLVLEETDDPETIPDGSLPDGYRRGGHEIKIFGQPTWVQNECFPAGPDGVPCRNLLTVENGWGDCGNWNILVHLDDDGLPDIAYFEASCC